MARYNLKLRKLSLLAVGALAVPGVLIAQPPPIAPRAPDKDASQIMVTAFKSNEKGAKTIGATAAEEMRNKMEGAFPFKQVYVIPVLRINPQLEASQFSTTEALEPHDAKALAVMLRADEYIAGAIERVPAGGFKASADLVLTRDIYARQPLGVSTAPKIGDAVNVLVKELKEARKQIDGEKKCTNAARSQKFPEAIAFAQAAIVAYPKSTLARICLVSVLDVSKAPATEVAKVARELVALDPRSNVGLGFMAKAFREAKQSDSLVVTLTNMIRNDPKNAQLQIDAINEIAASTNPGLARPIIDSAVTLNPGDPELLKLRWSILFAMKDYKEMVKQGEELIRLDTAFADTTYFQRTSVIFATDSQFQKAAEYSAKGVAKFPTNAQLVGMEIQQLRLAGQAQQALDKLDKATASKVPVANAGTLKILLLNELGKAAEATVVAKELIVAGDTTSALRQMVVNQVNAQFTAAQKGMSTDANKALEDLNATLVTLQYADSIAKPGSQKSQVAFINGATNLTLANIKAQQAQTGKSCQLAKDARVNANAAMINLPQGAGFAQPAQVQQLLGNAMQLDQGLDQMVKAYCK